MDFGKAEQCLGWHLRALLLSNLSKCYLNGATNSVAERKMNESSELLENFFFFLNRHMMVFTGSRKRQSLITWEWFSPIILRLLVLIFFVKKTAHILNMKMKHLHYIAHFQVSWLIDMNKVAN